VLVRQPKTAVFLGRNQITNISYAGSQSVNDIRMGVGFAFFWMMSSVDLMSQFLGSKLLWILGSDTSL